MKYESNILERLIKTYGVVGNPKYLSEIIKQFIIQGKECYPNLFTYQSDWLAHIDEFGLNPTYTVSYTGQSIYAPNTLEKPVKSAILTGSTKYRDIDTGEVLGAFEEGRNLELVPVKTPVLTTSNEDGTKTNILTVNDDVTLRGIGDVKDELDLLTGGLVQRIGEIKYDGSSDEQWSLSQHSTDDYVCAVIPISDSISQNGNQYATSYQVKSDKFSFDGNVGKASVSNEGINNIFSTIRISVSSSKLRENTVNALKAYLQQNPVTVQYQLKTESVKTVDLNIKDQNNQVVNHLTSFEGGTHFDISSQTGSVLPTLEVDVVVDLEETLLMCSTEGNTM